MKYLALLPLALLAFTSCKKNKSQDQHVYYKFAQYHRYQRIEDLKTNVAGHPFYGFADDSSHTTFLYEMVKAPKLIDGSYSSTLNFQAPVAGTHFTLNSADLAAQHAWYLTYGGWGDGTGQMLITTGIITGQLQPDSSWKISIAVSLPKKDDLMDRESIVDTIIAHDYRVGVEPIHYNGL